MRGYECIDCVICLSSLLSNRGSIESVRGFYILVLCRELFFYGYISPKSQEIRLKSSLAPNRARSSQVQVRYT
jgi:hypothetical protein